MTTFQRSLKSITVQGLDALLKIKEPLIGIITISLGVLFGYLINSPEAGELVISIVVVLILIVVIANNPLNGVLLWLFFMAFIDTWVKIPMGAGLPDLSFSRFSISFLSIFLLARATIGKFRFARVNLTDICIIVTTIGIMLSAPLSANSNSTGVFQLAISLHLTPLAIYFFAKNLVRDKKDLHHVFLVIALFGLVAGASAAYEHTTGHILFLQKGKSAETYLLFRGQTNIRNIRSLLGGTYSMGRALAMTIPVTFFLLFESKKRYIRNILLIAMLGVQFYGLIITMSRTPWYALLFALFIMQFFYPQFRKMFFLIVFVAAIVIFATWDQVSQSQVANRVNDDNSTLDDRQVRWQTGYNMWREKPIRGWGFGSFETESGRYRSDGRRKNITAIENDYLHILVSSGLIGFLPYLIFLITPLVNGVRLFFRTRAPDWPGFIKTETLAVYWAVILCFMITSYTAVVVRPTLKMIPFAIAGAVVGTHEHLLRGLKAKQRSAPNLLLATDIYRNER